MSRRSSRRRSALFGGGALIGACGVDSRDVGVASTENRPSEMAPGAAGMSAGDAGSGGAAGSELPAGSMAAGGTSPRRPGTFFTTGCGDRVLQTQEACDDGNRTSGDGCDSECLVTEAGFSCGIPGTRCMPLGRCGDALLASNEQCDDGNRDAGDGCSDRCQLEPGKQCPAAGQACTDSICGNSVREAIEACDDGNRVPFDGCSADCQIEPECAGQSCSTRCGDGLVIGEACDDGNLVDGDGCSSLCMLEGGFSCGPQLGCDVIVAGVCALRVPALFRDFADTQPDFADNGCDARAPGAVATRLDAGNRPVLVPGAAASQACLSDAASFSRWYASDAASVTLAGELRLFDDGNGGFVNRFGAEGQQFATLLAAGQALTTFDGTPLFFPVDSVEGGTAQRAPASIPVQFGALPDTAERTVLPGAPDHNFAFTMELRQRFLYRADLQASLTISADDDVWVFLNGQLALDLGGVHDPLSGTLSIAAASGEIRASVSDGSNLVSVSSTASFGLALDQTYELSIFHAERRPPVSSLLLRMRGFEAERTVCLPICGDGALSPGEECDDAFNDGGYGECQPGCLLGPYCGDGITQPEFGENCDVGPGGSQACRGCR